MRGRSSRRTDDEQGDIAVHRRIATPRAWRVPRADNRRAKWALQEIADLTQWVNDCQSGMYINCVYCGHRYGPREDTPVAMADVLKEHIEQCPKHPLSAAKAEIERLQEVACWAQAVVTALAVGDVASGSLLHHKLRDVMIAYREAGGT